MRNSFSCEDSFWNRGISRRFTWWSLLQNLFNNFILIRKVLLNFQDFFPVFTFPFILLYFDRSHVNISTIPFRHVPFLSGFIFAFFASLFTFWLLIIRATNSQLTVDVYVLISWFEAKCQEAEALTGWLLVLVLEVFITWASAKRWFI